MKPGEVERTSLGAWRCAKVCSELELQQERFISTREGRWCVVVKIWRGDLDVLKVLHKSVQKEARIFQPDRRD